MSPRNKTAEYFCEYFPIVTENSVKLIEEFLPEEHWIHFIITYKKIYKHEKMILDMDTFIGLIHELRALHPTISCKSAGEVEQYGFVIVQETLLKSTSKFHNEKIKTGFLGHAIGSVSSLFEIPMGVYINKIYKKITPNTELIRLYYQSIESTYNFPFDEELTAKIDLKTQELLHLYSS